MIAGHLHLYSKLFCVSPSSLDLAGFDAVDDVDQDTAEDSGAEGAKQHGHLTHIAETGCDFRSLVTE